MYFKANRKEEDLYLASHNQHNTLLENCSQGSKVGQQPNSLTFLPYVGMYFALQTSILKRPGYIIAPSSTQSYKAPLSL